MLPARELNRRIKQAIAALRAAGAKHLAVEISRDGATRIVETDSAQEQDGRPNDDWDEVLK